MQSSKAFGKPSHWLVSLDLQFWGRGNQFEATLTSSSLPVDLLPRPHSEFLHPFLLLSLQQSHRAKVPKLIWLIDTFSKIKKITWCPWGGKSTFFKQANITLQ